MRRDNQGHDEHSLADAFGTSFSLLTSAVLAAFGVPSESADASLLLAWLSRNMAMPAGCLLSIPQDLPQSINDHIIHLLQRLIKVQHHYFRLSAPSFLSTWDQALSARDVI